MNARTSIGIALAASVFAAGCAHAPPKSALPGPVPVGKLAYTRTVEVTPWIVPPGFHRGESMFVAHVECLHETLDGTDKVSCHAGPPLDFVASTSADVRRIGACVVPENAVAPPDVIRAVEEGREPESKDLVVVTHKHTFTNHRPVYSSYETTSSHDGCGDQEEGYRCDPIARPGGVRGVGRPIRVDIDRGAHDDPSHVLGNRIPLAPFRTLVVSAYAWDSAGVPVPDDREPEGARIARLRNRLFDDLVRGRSSAFALDELELRRALIMAPHRWWEADLAPELDDLATKTWTLGDPCAP